MLFSFNKLNEQNQLISLYKDSLTITSTTQGNFDESNSSNQLILDYDGDGQPDTTINLTQIITSTDHKENSIPSIFALFQNYPNPFNPITVIKYSLPRTENIILKVYDILGKEISVLVNEEKPAGFYEVQFDGGSLSSGVYFYQISSGENFIETKKMVLLK